MTLVLVGRLGRGVRNRLRRRCNNANTPKSIIHAMMHSTQEYPTSRTSALQPAALVDAKQDRVRSVMLIKPPANTAITRKTAAITSRLQ